MSFDGLKRKDIESTTKWGTARLEPVEQQLNPSMPVVQITIPYVPRPAFRAYHNRKHRFALTVAHRRAGKTVAEVNEGIKRVMTVNMPPGRVAAPQVAFISPTFGQSKRNAWPYAKHYTQNMPGIKVMEGDLTLVMPNGGRYIFAGSDNHDSLRGLHLDHVSLDEFGSHDPRVWGEVIRPALSDYGGSATFIGSAHGRNHFYNLLKQHEADPDWLITILRASETGILKPEELKAARETMTEEEYRQEYECDFDAAVKGTFYGKEISLAYEEKRIGRVLQDRNADTYAGWDLGKGAGMSLWVYQRTPGGEWHWIDYYEGASPDHGLEEAVSWVKTRSYKIDEHFLPHDANTTELQAGVTTRKEFLENRGLICTVNKKLPVADGISTVKVNFNRFFFDEERTRRGLECLKMYRMQEDVKKETFSLVPVHDWTSHAADAIRTAVMAMPENGRNAAWNMPIRRNLKVIA